MAKITFNLAAGSFGKLASRCEAERVRINKAMGKHRVYVGGFISRRYVMPRDIYPAATVPTRGPLKRFVDTVFWASLEREEGRPLAFSAAYDVPPTGDGYAIKFQAPFPFSVRAITKLAPATSGLPRWPRALGFFRPSTFANFRSGNAIKQTSDSGCTFRYHCNIKYGSLR